MRISEMNWMQVRDRATRDDRAVLPIGSTEQHAYLSLSVDSCPSVWPSKQPNPCTFRYFP